MALFVPLDQGIQAELVYRLGGLILSNRLWFRVEAGNPTTADLSAVGEGLLDWATVALMPVLSHDIRLLTIRTYDATVPYPGPQVATSAGIDGGISDDSHSANVAIKISFQTSTPPALWLNWNFVGGIPKSAVNINVIDPTYALALREAYIVLLDQFSLFEYVWSATSAVEDYVPLTTRNQYRIDHIRVRRPYVSQRRKRLNNPP